MAGTFTRCFTHRRPRSHVPPGEVLQAAAGQGAEPPEGSGGCLRTGSVMESHPQQKQMCLYFAQTAAAAALFGMDCRMDHEALALLCIYAEEDPQQGSSRIRKRLSPT